MNNKYLNFAVFSSGMTILAVELTASRLLGNVYGTSNIVWAVIIGLTLIYLTVGYFLGGKWADRWPTPDKFFLVMLWGAFASGIVPLVSKPVLRFGALAFDDLEIGVLLGSFVAVLILFIVPITLLGTMSPWAIRLSITEPEKAGEVSGKIYAISTIGSFIGTFVPVLILIPTVGTTKTFIYFSTYLMVVALVGLGLSVNWKAALKWSWLLVLLYVLFYALGGGTIKTTAGQIYETESAYNYIGVVEDNGYMYLKLNEGFGDHSKYHPTILRYNGPWMQFLAGPFFNSPPFTMNQVESMAVVGLAAGTTARQATEVFGPIPIDGIEIDPEIVQVGRDYFGMTMPNLNVIVADGRWALSKSEKNYTIIAIDAYRPPYIPWHLTTVEFFQLTRDHLTEDGVVVINVGRVPGDRGLIEALTTTLKEVFPTVWVMDIPGSLNSMVYATNQPTSFENLEANFAYLSAQGGTHQLLLDSIQKVLTYRQPDPQETVVLTDDLAPIETIVNRMVLSYITYLGD